MYRQPPKPILIGMAAGLILFIMPFFVLKVLFFLLIAGGLFRLLAGRRRQGKRFHSLHPVFADSIRAMSEEEYTSFRQSISGDFHYRKEIPITESK